MITYFGCYPCILEKFRKTLGDKEDFEKKFKYRDITVKTMVFWDNNTDRGNLNLD